MYSDDENHRETEFYYREEMENNEILFVMKANFLTPKTTKKTTLP